MTPRHPLKGLLPQTSSRGSLFLTFCAARQRAHRREGTLSLRSKGRSVRQILFRVGASAERREEGVGSRSVARETGRSARDGDGCCTQDADQGLRIGGGKKEKQRIWVKKLDWVQVAI